MITRSFHILLAILFLIGVVATAEDIDDVTAASDRAQITIIHALKEQDSGELVSVFASDAAVITPSGTSVEGKLTMRATAALLFNAFGTGNVTITRSHICIIDGVPYETGRYVFERPLDDAKVQKLVGRYTLIWKKEDGIWKVHRAISVY